MLGPAISTSSLLNTTSVPKAVPVRRWHQVQWQIVMRAGSAVVLNRTAPQTQPPVLCSVMVCPPDQIGIHDPAVLLPRLGAAAMDLTRHVSKLARDQDLVGRPEVGAPVDFHILIREAPKSVLAVEQHGGAVDAVGKSFGELAAGGEQHRLGGTGERGPVGRGQRLPRGGA